MPSRRVKPVAVPDNLQSQLRTVRAGDSVLFTGPNAAGKTMAAEVLANGLGLPLIRIDLSQVVSKYIGETEKNLNRIFDAAEKSGAVLLFDEADALFGKRTEVKDAHDRLFQRIEAGKSLVILSTSASSALPPAWRRKTRIVVNFA